MKVKYHIRLIGFLWALSSGMHAQPFIIQGTIEYANQGIIYLASYYGDRFTIADSVDAGGGSFRFILSEEDPAGIYRIIYPEIFQGIRSENRFVEFIYNREDIEFNVTHGDEGPVPSFANSLENQVYFDFMTFQLDYEASLMQVYGRLYPARPGEPDYREAVAAYESLQHGRNRYMDSVSALHPGLYATRIMNAFRAPVIPGAMSHRERIDTLKNVFFHTAAIDDPDLLYAPVYTFRLVDYLSLFKVDTFTMEQQEQQFIEAVDRIMANVSPQEALWSFVVEFMLEGFELLGMEEVQLHLADHYLEASCGSDIVELVNSRMETYRTMNTGSVAPDFVIRDVHGKTHRLSELPDPYVLVMFWASECEHCHEMIGRLKEWYLSDRGMDVEVVAISVDTLATPFEAYLRETEMPWITARDPLGWYGKVPGDYHVYGTPMMFLLDSKRTILSRPLNFRQFYRAVKMAETQGEGLLLRIPVEMALALHPGDESIHSVWISVC